jgi:hypothetical protein
LRQHPPGANSYSSSQHGGAGSACSLHYGALCRLVRNLLTRLFMDRTPKSFASVSITLLGLCIATGCGSGTDIDPDVCPQTREFGNYGCARIVVFVQTPPDSIPFNSRLDVRARPAQPSTGAESAFAPIPRGGENHLEIIRYTPPALGTEDTLSYWISSRILEIPQPIPVGTPLPVFAEDSVLRVISFARVGSRPRSDTVRLVLRRVR